MSLWALPEATQAPVEALEQAGQAVPDAAAIAADEPDPEAEDGEADEAAAASLAAPLVEAAAPASMSAEEAITRLRDKIDRGFSRPLIKTVRGVGYKIEG